MLTESSSRTSKPLKSSAFIERGVQLVASVGMQFAACNATRTVITEDVIIFDDIAIIELDYRLRSFIDFIHRDLHEWRFAGNFFYT